MDALLYAISQISQVIQHYQWPVLSSKKVSYWIHHKSVIAMFLNGLSFIIDDSVQVIFRCTCLGIEC